ncbi:MAG: methyltransferase domain-containing protein [Gammaproteobacteria bacterium]
MICHEAGAAVFARARALLRECGVPARQESLYERVLRHAEQVATRCEVFLPVDLPTAVALAAGVDDEAALRAATACTLLWMGADQMDDAADGELPVEEWEASAAQLALVHTNLLATLPHLAAGTGAGADFSQRLSVALWVMSHGQFADLESAHAVQSEDDALAVVAAKTGAETAFFASAPMLLAGNAVDDVEAWEAFGFNIGCMVQLHSDIHAAFVDAANNDLLQGKRTFPVMHTLGRLPAAARDEFLDRLVDVARGDRERLVDAWACMHTHGAAQQSLEQAERFRYRAAAAVPLPLARLERTHPLRVLLKSGWLWREPPPATKSKSSPDGDRADGGMPRPGHLRLPPAPSRTAAARQARRVADYYDEHTEPFYLRLWDAEDIHFGLFDTATTDLRTALKAMTRSIIEPANIGVDDCVVDAGCGVGGAALDIAREHGANVIGLTVSPRQVEIARARAASAGLDGRVRFEVADCANRLPLPDGSVDVVVSIEAACHFADKSRFLAECRRVLRPGGRLVGSDWMRRESTSAAAAARVEAVERSWRLAGLARADEWRAMLEAAGFEAVEVEDYAERVLPNARLLVQAELDLMLECAAPAFREAHCELWRAQYTSLANAWLEGVFTIARVGGWC